MMEKKSKDLIPHERHIVLSISALAKVDLKNESEVLAKTSELVNSVKSLSLEATKLIEALDKPQGNNLKIFLIKTNLEFFFVFFLKKSFREICRITRSNS